MDTEKKLRRLEWQNRLLSQKLYQVCLSHDHLSTVLHRGNMPMTATDKVMMETTKRIMTAKTPEEIETIYSESSSKIFKGFTSPPPAAPQSGVQKVWFFPKDTDTQDFISQIEDIVAQINEQINSLDPENRDLYEQGMQDDEGDDDTDSLSPPF